MNQINEIKVEADVFCDQNYPDASEAEYNQLWEYKFAELIVRECVKSIENTIETKCDTDSEKMGCEFAITDLKENFGVRE